jgi:CRISPR-associated endonuclease/helicase Cas3
MNLYSHPDKLLIDHLKMVANNCSRLIAERILFVDNPLKRQVLLDLAYLAGSFHDLGKGTIFFQHYLLTQEHEVIGPKNHALISALFVKEVSKEYLNRTSLSNIEKDLLVHFIFTAVKRHHGRLENFEDEIYIESKSKELQEQIVAFYEEETEAIITHFNLPLLLDYRFESFKKYILSKEYLTDMPEFYLEFSEDNDFNTTPIQEKIEYYYFHQLLFSVLLLSDKSDVVLDKEYDVEKASIPYNKVEAFREKKGFNKPKNRLDEIKNEAFDNTLQNLSRVFSLDKHAYSITLPTGLGKTITSFAVALKIKELVKLPSCRLIITIPFTSIIDQNFEVYSQIVGTDNSNFLLKHHHLAEPVFKLNDQELTPSRSEFLIETWQSEVVVTTFVQLLNSIFSNDKSLLMKLPNLANSIVILDEVQAVPYEYWQLIKNTFEVLGKTYNCYFILMSATQPLMFLPEQEIIEIVPSYKKYFNYFNRTRLINKTNNQISFAAFIEEVSHYLSENEKKDVLIILNTKKHSKQCFEQLRCLINSGTECIYYLSTMITPYERKKIISLIKEKYSGRKIIVSTQLIEAGVDISVDTVFRAMSPIDSIIQSAGRANRYNEKSHQSEVYLYEIEELRKATSFVYGADLIQKSKNVLKNIDTIDEKDYLILIQNYFKEVRKQSDVHVSQYLKAMSTFSFKDVGMFSLIEEQKAESVFVQLNQEAKNIWEQYVNIWERPTLEIYEKKIEFSRLKSSFYDYVINVPIPQDQKNIKFDSEPIFGFYLSRLESPSKFYSYSEDDFTKNTGYNEINTLNF